MQREFKSAADFARFAGAEKPTYTHHENGTRGFKMPTAKRYAELLQIDLNWLLTGSGSPFPESDLSPVAKGIVRAPVISWVQAGELTEVSNLASFEAEDSIPVSHNRTSVFALKVAGTSMNRVAPPGSHIVVDYSDRHLIPGRYYVFRLDNSATFKVYRESPIRLEPDSTEPHDTIFPDGEMHVIGRVIAVVKPL